MCLTSHPHFRSMEWIPLHMQLPCPFLENMVHHFQIHLNAQEVLRHSDWKHVSTKQPWECKFHSNSNGFLTSHFIHPSIFFRCLPHGRLLSSFRYAVLYFINYLWYTLYTHKQLYHVHEAFGCKIKHRMNHFVNELRACIPRAEQMKVCAAMFCIYVCI